MAVSTGVISNAAGSARNTVEVVVTVLTLFRTNEQRAEGIGLAERGLASLLTTVEYLDHLVPESAIPRIRAR